MSKDTKKKKSCRPLDEHQSQQLARMIIASTRREIRCDKSRESYGANGCRNSFLKSTILPIAPQVVTREDYRGNSYNLITQENYEYLRDSYFHYAKLMNVKVEHTPGRTIGESIVNVYNEMNDLVNKSGMYLNLEDDNGSLYFNVWNTHTWGEYTLYYFPVKFIEELNPTLRRIVITFYHDFMKENGIATINDEDDMYWTIDMLSEGYYEDEDAKERRAREKLVKSYKDGRAYKLLDRVWRKSYYKNLPKAIEVYDCKNGFEQGLIELLRRGLEFIKTEKAIMYYGYDPFFDEEPDYLPMSLEQQIRVVYDSNDIVTEYLIDFFNSSRQETYEIIPASTFAVSPKTDKVFTLEDTYPERFFKWADDFIHYIR